jgi:CheY-like chemotaxis protein
MSTSSILLIDDDTDILLVFGERCRQMGLHVRCAHNLLTALAMVEARIPDLICIDVKMPTGNGLRFCEMLAESPDTEHIPIIVLTGLHDAATIQACGHIKAHYVPKRPDVWTELRPHITRLLNDHASAACQPARSNAAPVVSWPAPPYEQQAADSPLTSVGSSPRVVVADDEPDVVNLLTERFTRLGCSVIGAATALEAVNVIYRSLPDLVCIDVGMPAGNGLSVCEMMASDGLLRSVPAIVLTGKTDKETIRRCHDLMVYYVQKGGDIWSRVEPLARELLGLENRLSGVFADATTLPPRRVSSSHASRGTTIRREVRPGVAERPAAAAGPVATVTTTALKATSPQPTEPTMAHETLLDAVFAMLGGCGTDSTAVGLPDENDENQPAGASSTEPPWVLCIDDDVDFSIAMKCRLESCGVAVTRAYSGMEGYRLAFTRPASAILLDFSMPDGQGDYILSRLQDNPVTKQIPVIVITGKSDKMLQRRMLNLGAKEFFTKPVKFERLRDALAKYIDILAEPVS